MAEPERIRPTDQEDVSTAVRELLADVGDLVRSELNLAVLELRSAVSTVAISGVWLVVGLALIYLAMIFLLLAVTAALAATMPWSTAALIVGVVVLVVGGIVAYLGFRKFASAQNDLALTTTRETLRENVEWLRNRTR